MGKYLKIILLGLIIGLSLTLAGCSTEGPATDEFTVVFVDYDGTVLKTITCTVGEECEITAPEEPDSNEECHFIINDTVKNCDFFRWSILESQWSSIDRDTEIKAIYQYSNILVQIFDRNIVFYSFFIITGIIVALSIGMREVKRIGIKQDDLLDGFLWIVPISIFGARLWYVAFEPASFIVPGQPLDSFWQIIGFNVVENHLPVLSSFGLAGLAIHGAFFTALFCAIIYTKKRKIDIFKVLDIVAVGFIIAQAFGRWGNFFNQEAHGGLVGLGTITDGTTTLTAAQLEAQFNYLRYTLHIPEFIVNNMYILRGFHSLETEVLTGYYHPTFFYESTVNLIGFGIMLLLRRWKKIHFGELLSFYLIWYGILRIFIETMRTDPLPLNIFGLSLKTAIVTSVLMIIAGLSLSTYIRLKRKGQTYGTVPGYFGYKKETATTETQE